MKVVGQQICNFSAEISEWGSILLSLYLNPWWGLWSWWEAFPLEPENATFSQSKGGRKTFQSGVFSRGRLNLLCCLWYQLPRWQQGRNLSHGKTKGEVWAWTPSKQSPAKAALSPALHSLHFLTFPVSLSCSEIPRAVGIQGRAFVLATPQWLQLGSQMAQGHGHGSSWEP